MAIWIALLVLVLGVAGGLAYAVVRGISLWRHLKRTGRTFGEETGRITQAVDWIATHLDRAGESNARLAAASDRLRTSRQRLDLQLAAVREARAAIGRTFWFLPGV